MLITQHKHTGNSSFVINLIKEMECPAARLRESIIRHVRWELGCLKWIIDKAALARRHYLARAIFVIVAIIMIWRGIWNLIDMYLLPAQPVLSSVLSIGVGMLLLFLDDFRLDEMR